MKDYFNQCKTGIFRIAFFVWIICLIVNLIRETYLYFGTLWSYRNWALSDWMINYQSGFIRRGIVGEILLQIYKIYPFDLQPVIVCLTCIPFFILLYLFVKLFRKEGWSMMILLAPFFIIHLMCMNVYGMRRDFLAILITWGIFSLYRRWIDTQKCKTFFMLQLLSIFTVLMHEASFFFTFPLLYLHYYRLNKSANTQIGDIIRKCLFFFTPSIITMAVVCLFKGDTNSPQIIWDSWQPLFDNYPLGNDCGQEIGNGVRFLSKGMFDAFKFHLDANYGGYFYESIPGWPVTLLNMVLVYVFVTNMNVVDLKWNKLKKYNKIMLSGIIMLQFIFLLPLFTVLSCDWSRTLPYWVSTSLIAYHYFKNDIWLIPNGINKISIYIQKKIERSVLMNPLVYCLILFSLAIPKFGIPKYYDSLMFKIYLVSKKVLSIW